MSISNFLLNVHYLPFYAHLPYGVCSKYATNISAQHNPFASMLLLGHDPDATVKAAEAYRKNTLDRSRYMVTKGWVTEKHRPCGCPSQDQIFRTITREGLSILTDYPNNISFLDFLPVTGRKVPISPLATGFHQAETIRITTSGSSPNHLYALWCQSHLQAMFRANGHLTCLDRKPYGSGIVLGPIRDEASYQRYIHQYGNTLLAYIYRTLTDFYTSTPGSYTITQLYPDTSRQTYDDWLQTPAFYLLNELLDLSKETGSTPTLYGSKQTMARSHIGLAIGRNVNYACYHTYPSKFRWIKKREQSAQAELNCALHLMKTQSPHLPYKPSVDFALLFCPTRHQFFNIFKSTIDRHKAGKSTPCPIDGPYTSTHIIPINDTGTYMLRRFLEESPESLRLSCTNYLLESDDRFGDSVNYYYPLTYRGKRVFAGYTMDIKRIHKALVDHLNGQDFYILCYPEQLPWYRMLFPNKTFL